MRTLSSPVVLALCAGCLLIGSTGGAVAGAKITGKQIKNESVTGKDVKDRSLTSKEFSADAASSLQGPPGPVGAQGPKGNNGTNGTNGSNGANGVSGYETRTATDAIPSGGDGTASRTCSAGRTLIGAFGYLSTSVHPVMVVWDSSDTASAFTQDVPTANTLTLRITCADVTP
jgi:hypothetical protein